MARYPSISEEEYGRWWSPAQALAALKTLADSTAISEILERLKFGKIAAVGDVEVLTNDYGDTEVLSRHKIDRKYWDRADNIDEYWHSFWKTGRVHFLNDAGMSDGGLVYFDVRLDPEAVKAIPLPNAPLPGTPPKPAPTPDNPFGLREETNEKLKRFGEAMQIGHSGPSVVPPFIRPNSDQIEPPKHPGGRPAKAFWEAVLIEMARQLYEGELQPSKQADVLRAMQDWLSKNGHEAGDTQVKERARKLWEAIKR